MNSAVGPERLSNELAVLILQMDSILSGIKKRKNLDLNVLEMEMGHVCQFGNQAIILIKELAITSKDNSKTGITDAKESAVT